MHQTSLAQMKNLLAPRSFPGAMVLDCGSKVQHGQASYRPLVRALGMHYTGLDAEPGPNVDVVANIYEACLGIEFDFVISGQLLEHLEAPWLAVEKMKSHVKPGGWVVLIAPFIQAEHKYPLDCWRLLPDGVKYMLRDWEEVEAGLLHPVRQRDLARDISDCWGLARRPSSKVS